MSRLFNATFFVGLAIASGHNAQATTLSVFRDSFVPDIGSVLFPLGFAAEETSDDDPTNPTNVALGNSASSDFVDAEFSSFAKFKVEGIPEFGSRAEIEVIDFTRNTRQITAGGEVSGTYERGEKVIPYRISNSFLELSGLTGGGERILGAALEFEISVIPHNLLYSSSAINLRYGQNFEFSTAFPDRISADEYPDNNLMLDFTFSKELTPNKDDVTRARFEIEVHEGALDLLSLPEGELFDFSYSWQVLSYVDGIGGKATAQFFDPLNLAAGDGVDLSGQTPVFENATSTPAPVPLPSTFGLMALGLAALSLRRHIRPRYAR